MKNFFTIIVLTVLSLNTLAQEKKTVAVLDPICRDNSVNPFFQQMVRGAMESAVTTSSEYEAYDRSAFDQIQKEQAFQRTGAVNDSQIKKMGEMAGVDYVLVSEVSAYDGYLAAVIKILNVTTGKYDRSIDDFTELRPESVKSKCKELASSLFGELLSGGVRSKSRSRKAPAGYVDLGLPSGVFWKKENENGFYRYEQMGEFCDYVPRLDQWEELKDYCQWTWGTNENNVHGYFVEGTNGESIFLPAAGFKTCPGVYGDDGIPGDRNRTGMYWSSTSTDKTTAYEMYFTAYKMSLRRNGAYCTGHSVRLVRTQESEYVDLGLPSGTLWKSTNEDEDINFEEVQTKYAEKLPTKAQWEELIKECTWTFMDPGWWYTDDEFGDYHEGCWAYYMIKGKNGNSISLPAQGYTIDNLCYGCGFFGGIKGFYYSSEMSKYLYFDDSSIEMSNWLDVGYTEEQIKEMFLKIRLVNITKE